MIRINNEDSETIPSKPFAWKFSNQELTEKAKTELNETPEKVALGIVELRKSAKEIKCCAEDDEYLLKFLRVKKFRHSDSLKMLNGFSKSLRTSYERLGPVDITSLERVYRGRYSGILQYRDPDGRPIMFYRFGNTAKGISVKEAMKSTMLCFFNLMEHPESQILGINYIVDCESIRNQDITGSIEVGYLFAQFLAKLPLRIHRMDIVNESYLFRMIYMALKPFTPRKILDRIAFHGKDREFLKRIYHEAALPPEFGGTAEPLSNEHWIGNLDEIVKRYVDMQNISMS